MGTAAYTEYTLDKRFVDYIEEDFDRRAQWKLGHIHSHNVMKVFFSGVDMQELYDNAPNHNFYLSLIVNNYMDMTAKIAFIGSGKKETEVFVEALDEKGKPFLIAKEVATTNIENIYLIDCDIHSTKPTIKVERDFAEKVAKIMEPKPVAPVTTIYRGTGGINMPTEYVHHPFTNPNFSVPKGFNQVAREETWSQTRIPWTREDEPIDLFSALSVDGFFVKLFTCWSEIRPEDDAEDIIYGLEDMEITELEIATKALERYPKLFVEHFQTDRIEDFIVGTHKILDILIDYVGPYPKIAKAYEGIVKMVEKVSEDEYNRPEKQV